MTEHRKASRQRALKGAQIVLNQGASVIDCIARDISSTGARLRVASPLGIPEQFDLVIGLDGTRHKCRVAWRRADEIGVEFE
ncbi:PilZ domain-containing protein [Micromonospora sp. STR1s_5]|nr:PilZ domain-containing protein [Micromonospora sp. STR1s_5]